MAVDMFLKIDGIPGESVDANHKGEIVLESFSWGETNSGAARAAASGVGAGRVSMQDFHFTARVSIATPKLMLACAAGQHIKSAQVTFRQAQNPEGRTGNEFLFYKFTGVFISSVQQAGEVADRPLDSVSFAFQKIQVEYKEQKPDGALGATVDFAWDLSANKKG
jgi:type VI secretion system secreted protein Hcp